MTEPTPADITTAMAGYSDEMDRLQRLDALLADIRHRIARLRAAAPSAVAVPYPSGVDYSAVTGLSSAHTDLESGGPPH